MSDPRQLVSGVIGGVVGFLVGGPIGAGLGFSMGLGAGTLLFPGELPPNIGPQIDDQAKVEADPGAPICVGWGSFVVPGYRMAIGERSEQSTTEEVEGKGAPTQTTTTTRYFQTLALGLCEGPITGVRRIWENGKLVYDVTPQSEAGFGDTPFSEADYDILNLEWSSIRVAAQWGDINWVAEGYPDGNPISAAGQAIMTAPVQVGPVTVEQWVIVREAALFTDINWSAAGYVTYADRVEMSATYAEGMVLYYGTTDQEPDPTLEEEFGTGQVPGYRELAYIVFPGRELTSDQGHRHPVFKVEIDKVDLTLLSLTPDEIGEGETGPTVTLTGVGFIPESVAYFNGVAKTTTYVSNTELTMELDDTDVDDEGEFDVFVRNAVGWDSNELPFDVTAPAFTRVVFTDTNQFASANQWVVPSGVTEIDILLVGGGAGGTTGGITSDRRGGAGAGGVVTAFNVAVTPGHTLRMVVGGGGAGAVDPSTGGSSSVVNLSAGSAVIAGPAGSGGEAPTSGAPEDGSANNGNGAGGNIVGITIAAPGTGDGSGFAGGTAFNGGSNATRGSGGGGGAGEAGQNANGSTAANGGAGIIPPHNRMAWGTDIGEGGYFAGGGPGRLGTTGWTVGTPGIGHGANCGGGGSPLASPSFGGTDGDDGIIVVIY